MRGLIAGMAGGSVLAALGLGVVSLVAPLPEAPGAGLAAALAAARDAAPPAEASAPLSETATTGAPPAGSEFARAPADAQPVRPAPPLAPALPQPGPASVAPAPPEGPRDAPAAADTEPPARPEPVQEAPAPQVAPEPAPAALAKAPQPEDPVPVPPPGEVSTPALEPAELPQGADPNQMPIALGDGQTMLMPDGTVLPRDEALARMAGAAPSVSPVAPTAPAMPGGEAAVTVMPSEAPLELPAEVTKPRVFAAGETGGSFGQKPAPLGSVAGAMPAAAEAAQGVVTNRLPRIGAPAADTPADSAADDAAASAGASDVPPLRRYAQPFTAPEGAALYAVILIDPGVAAGGLDRATIKALGLPMTIAIDPARPDAAEAAADYRAAGFEVAILASGLPANATPADLAVTVEAWRRILPEAVGVVDGPDASFRQSRALVQPMVDILAREGLGVFVMDEGLNAARQIAQSADAGYAGIWREIDAARDRSAVIERMLSRAAFEAQKNGAVSVLLSAWPESVAGLQNWEPVATRSVVLAPVSALVAD
ncbi:MAG: divergent polysaccharide deacetylase family protein [Paracoccaceae bacterium]|jgi:hypothetical protein